MSTTAPSTITVELKLSSTLVEDTPRDTLERLLGLEAYEAAKAQLKTEQGR